MRIRNYLAVILLIWLLALYAPTPAQAQFNFGNEAQKYLRDQLGKAFGEQAPFVLDPNQAFQQVPADQAPTPDNFKPILLKTLSDLNRPLLPGDYSFNAMFYCTQWSVHRPGRGHPYTLGRAQGRLAKQMTSLLYQGTIKGVSPSTMNAMAWRIQAGVPLNQWPDPEKTLVHELTPQYENDFQGDWLQRIEDKYNHTFRIFTRKSFDDELKTLGDLGQLALNMKAAHRTLTDQTVVPGRLPDLMFQQFGAGGIPQLPDDPDHPSPWINVSAGIMARFTVHQGNLGENLMELHITPEANRAGKGPTLSGIMNNEDSGGGSTDEDTGLVGYSPDSQSPAIEPVLGKDPVVDHIELKLDKPEVGVGDAITGTAIPEDKDGKPVPGKSVTLTFAERPSTDAADNNSDNNNNSNNAANLGSTTANGDKYPFSFNPHDTPGKVVVTASAGDNSNDDASANADQSNASSPITATANENVDAVKSLPKPTRAFFYIAYVNPVTDKPQSFLHAAKTWEEEIKQKYSFDATKDKFIEDNVTTASEFMTKWKDIYRITLAGKYTVLRGAIFSHSTLPIGGTGFVLETGLEFGSEPGTAPTAGSTLNKDLLEELPRLDWGSEGELQLFGCNTGIMRMGLTSWCPASVLAANQHIITTGEMGYAYFSQNETKYVAITANSTKIYLEGFKRLANSRFFFFPNGARIPPKIFTP